MSSLKPPSISARNGRAIQNEMNTAAPSWCSPSLSEEVPFRASKPRSNEENIVPSRVEHTNTWVMGCKDFCPEQRCFILYSKLCDETHTLDIITRACCLFLYLRLSTRTKRRRELSPQEDSPFLGEIRPGSEQPAVCNGLFRAPIFKHTVRIYIALVLGVWNVVY